MTPEQQVKNEQEIARAREAQQVVNTPVYRESWAALKQEIIDRWAACPARDTEGREWLWQHYQVALKFEESLNTLMNTGKLAIAERELSLVEKAVRIVRR